MPIAATAMGARDQRPPEGYADIVQQHPGAEGAHHVLRAVGEIDDVQQAKMTARPRLKMA